jgi:hypothetical protein
LQIYLTHLLLSFSIIFAKVETTSELKMKLIVTVIFMFAFNFNVNLLNGFSIHGTNDSLTYSRCKIVINEVNVDAIDKPENAEFIELRVKQLLNFLIM